MTEKTLKIVLIDDDKIALKAVSKLFRPYGVEVICFQDPQEGIDGIAMERPDLVFLDYLMPNFNGDDVIIKLSEAKLFNDCSLYLLSANDFSDVQVIKFRTLGFYDVLKKPLSKEVIEAIFVFHFGKVPGIAA